MSNRVSKYLNPHKLVPSEPSSFDDFMVRALAVVLKRMVDGGLGTKEELLREYSDGRFSTDAALYCAELQVDDITVTPRQVFQFNSENVGSFWLAVHYLIQEHAKDEEAAESLREQWGLIFRSFCAATYFAVWRMAYMEDTRDDDDTVGLYGAFCNRAGDNKHWQVEISGIMLACHFKAMLRADMLQPVGTFA